MSRLTWLAIGIGLGAGVMLTQRQTGGLDTLRDQLADRLDAQLDRMLIALDTWGHGSVERLRAQGDELAAAPSGTILVTETLQTEV